jgi:hypothetical protein
MLVGLNFNYNGQTFANMKLNAKIVGSSFIMPKLNHESIAFTKRYLGINFKNSRRHIPGVFKDPILLSKCLGFSTRRKPPALAQYVMDDLCWD